MTEPVRVGGEFLVNTATQNDRRNPTITALSDGRFVVACPCLPTVARDTHRRGPGVITDSSKDA